MEIIYSDDRGLLSSEMSEIMAKAAAKALDTEFEEDFAAMGTKADELDVEIGVTIVDDDEIRVLNRDYRGKDSVTDVLSFPQFESNQELIADIRRDDRVMPVLIGDVVICYEQALRQADEYGTGTTRELIYLFVHSIMHLLGYDHMDEEERSVMREREESVLRAVGIGR